jgi:DNA-binding NarL/FixJ family response regulator
VADRELRLAVVARYPALRAGLRAILGEHSLVVTAEASDVDELVQPVADTAWDVVIVDPGPTGEADLLADAPSIRALVLGPISSAERLPALMNGRAWGYLPRETDGATLASAVRAIAAGLVVMDAALAPTVVAPRPPAVSVDQGVLEDLSPRERQVLHLVAEGLANKEIARHLKISEHTAKFHVAAILSKLGAASRTEAVHLAARRGLIAL